MSSQADVFDVAAYILKKLRSCTHMKLQKLVYYSQAWSLVWDEKQLFRDKIEAWANGPVVPKLFRHLKGKFVVTPSDIPNGNSGKLDADRRETIDAVIEFYGDKSPQWLSDLTHAETPWIDARRGLPPGERGSNEITTASMADYYSGL